MSAIYRFRTLLPLLCIGCSAAWAAQSFPLTMPLNAQYVVRIAAGEGEAASIGTYSLRVFRMPAGEARADADLGLGTFVQGRVVERDGTLIKAELCRRGRERELQVILQSAGSGGYLSRDIYRLRGTPLQLLRKRSGSLGKSDFDHPCRAH